MRTIKFTAFLFYRYYSKGATSSIPYFSTICALTMFGAFHLFQFLLLVNKAKDFLPNRSGERLIDYIKVLLFLMPLYILISILVKEKELKEMEFDQEKVNKGNIYLFIYIIVSFLLLIVMALWRKNRL